MTPSLPRAGIGWFGVVRLGTVQAAIGAMVMLATSLLNRVMVVEYSIAAAVPAGLVAWHYGVQLSRPLWGHKSDRTANRSGWIIAGMGILALGALIAVDATIMMSGAGFFGIFLAVIGFSLIGLGVGMAGTALLALLASRVVAERKPAAAAISWTMMVAGIVVAAGVSGSFLDPFSEARLAIVTSLVVLVAFCLAMLALRGLERNSLPGRKRQGFGKRDKFRPSAEGYKSGPASATVHLFRVHFDAGVQYAGSYPRAICRLYFRDDAG